MYIIISIIQAIIILAAIHFIFGINFGNKLEMLRSGHNANADNIEKLEQRILELEKTIKIMKEGYTVDKIDEDFKKFGQAVEKELGSQKKRITETGKYIDNAFTNQDIKINKIQEQVIFLGKSIKSKRK